MVLKKWLLISTACLSIIAFVFVISNKYLDSKEQTILSSKDNSMTEYHDARATALYFVKYLNIDSEESYTTLKSKMKELMSKSIYDEYFYSDDFPMGYKNVSVTTNSIRGEKEGDSYIFKLDLDYVSDSVSYNFIYLVTIQDMKIRSIEKL